MPEKKTRKSKKIEFTCDFCKQQASATPSAYAKTKKHFCSKECYQSSRKASFEGAVICDDLPTIAELEWPAFNPVQIETTPVVPGYVVVREITAQDFMQYLRTKYENKVVKEDITIPTGSVVPIIVKTYGSSLSDIELLEHHERETRRKEIEVLKKQNQFKQAQCATNMGKS